MVALRNIVSRGASGPYQQHLLTRVMQDAIGGNSRTIMVAIVDASNAQKAEDTLTFAAQLSKIRNRSRRHVDNEKIGELKKELAEAESGKATRATNLFQWGS